MESRPHSLSPSVLGFARTLITFMVTILF
uniref:Uncharacterized protein n=1 Tax=Anguilla anguilla TaxID=7936 RepID=A0A0E9SLH7_ANGAN